MEAEGPRQYVKGLRATRARVGGHSVVKVESDRTVSRRDRAWGN